MKSLGISLPSLRPRAASYVTAQQSGRMLVVSGTMPLGDAGPLFMGALGRDVTISEGQAAARMATLLLLSHAREAIGNLDRIGECLRLEVFVRATPDFEDHPAVANGASAVLKEILEHRGSHTRFAVGVASLPFGVPVEVGAWFRLTEESAN